MLVRDGLILGKDVHIVDDFFFDRSHCYLISIGDNTTIRECVTINKGTVDKHRTEVGENCLIMAYVHLGHDCIIGDRNLFSNNALLAGHVHVENACVLSGNTAVHQFS